MEKYSDQAQYFMESISVKEYTLYQDALGFHGGTLGPNSEKAIDNILKMYAQGGISIIDRDVLIFSLLNCSDYAAGGSALRTSLENYLLGGAALMMFDEGYGSIATNFLEKIPDTIKKLLPANLNLYQLNGAYIPASYLLETIYQNLKQFYNLEVEKYTSNFIQHNKVIITTGPQQYYKGEEDVSWLTKFEEVSQQVVDVTQIKFSFMAGMLDIFSNLAIAFDIKY